MRVETIVPGLFIDIITDPEKCKSIAGLNPGARVVRIRNGKRGTFVGVASSPLHNPFHCPVCEVGEHQLLPWIAMDEDGGPVGHVHPRSLFSQGFEIES